ncbi:MAG: hypothetical protein Ct9H300mP24_5640 [Candidatus Neomarinimicrobiota bacterium]|nr:MAG: hypothetical protein Ct9H300mP24_5640 [Candidatus Neomarinimicrobiota bacterium]
MKTMLSVDDSSHFSRKIIDELDDYAQINWSKRFSLDEMQWKEFRRRNFQIFLNKIFSLKILSNYKLKNNSICLIVGDNSQLGF